MRRKRKVILKPLVKYPGTKYGEYAKFKDFIPEVINNYYEPFFGGGGVFFNLKNEGRVLGTCHMNDLSKSLIHLYRNATTGEFRENMSVLSYAWDDIRRFGDSLASEFVDRGVSVITSQEPERFVDDCVSEYIDKGTSALTLDTHGFSISDTVKKVLNDKFSRFSKFDSNVDAKQLSHKCVMTSVCNSYYNVLRDMYNDWGNRGSRGYTDGEMAAQYWFVRELCFGSMFRFGSDGDFNVGYGGVTYNTKNFRKKVARVTSDDMVSALSTLDVMCGDFEQAVGSWDFSENDFMFVDPPYDETFTEYDNNAFTAEDHARLHNCLMGCDCKWLMVIGKTDFITNLYKECHMIEYDKTYTCQTKWADDGKYATHLLVANYDIGNCR